MIIRSHDSMNMQNYKKKGNKQRFLKKKLHSPSSLEKNKGDSQKKQ